MLKQFIVFSSILFVLCFASCTKSKNKNENESRKLYSHTLKLQKKLFVKFKSENTVRVDFKPEYTNMLLQIFLKNKNSRELIETMSIAESNDIEFSLDKNLKNFEYLVAIVKGIDMQGNPISAVDTYKIGEQTEINRIKERLKNRN